MYLDRTALSKRLPIDSTLVRRLELQRIKPALLSRSLLPKTALSTDTRSVTRTAEIKPVVLQKSAVGVEKTFPIVSTMQSIQPKATITTQKTALPTSSINPAISEESTLEEMLKTESGDIPPALLPAGSSVKTAGMAEMPGGMTTVVLGIAAAITAYLMFAGDDKKPATKEKGLSGVKKTKKSSSRKPGVRTKTKNKRGSVTKAKAANPLKKSGRVQTIDL